jgi:hypothetical protein
VETLGVANNFNKSFKERCKRWTSITASIHPK